MSDSTSELIFLIKKGRAAAFALEVQTLVEQGETPAIEGATFNKKTINKFHFKGIDMTNVAFEECNLSECIFEECLLEGTFFDNTSLMECAFIGCHGEGFALDTCTIGHSSFAAMQLTAPEWSDTQFNDCALSYITLEEPLLERLTLRNGSLEAVTCNLGELTHVTLRDMDEPKNLELNECVTQSCYVVGDDDVIPEGFSKKTGRRRTL